MNKSKIENAKNLKTCATITIWVGVICSIVVMFLNVGNDPTWGFIYGIASGLPLILASVVAYFTLVVLADISDSLAKKDDDNNEVK